jgi:hypothetical protein
MYINNDEIKPSVREIIRIKILTLYKSLAPYAHPRICGLDRSIEFNPDKTNRAPPPSKWTVGKNGRRMYNKNV